MAAGTGYTAFVETETERQGAKRQPERDRERGEIELGAPSEGEREKEPETATDRDRESWVLLPSLLWLLGVFLGVALGCLCVFGASAGAGKCNERPSPVRSGSWCHYWDRVGVP